MKLLKNLKEKKNKGFSLVELIVVIAIMAVLIGVVALTVTRFVEKGRVSADGENIEDVVKAVNVTLSDPDADLDSTLTFTVARSNKDIVVTMSEKLAAAVAENYGGDVTSNAITIKIKSKKYGSGDVSGSISNDTCTIKVGDESFK